MADLPETVETLLEGVRKRLVLRRFAIVGLQVLAAVTLALAALMLVDGLWVLSSGVRWAWWSLLVITLGAWVVYRAILPWLKPRDLVEEARHIEGLASEDLEEAISTAVSLAHRPQHNGIAQWMLRRTIAAAGQRAAELSPQTLISYQQLRRRSTQVGGLVLVLAVSCLHPAIGSLAVRALWPGAEVQRISTTQIVVRPGDITLNAGERLQIIAEISPSPQQADVLIYWPDGSEERLSLEDDQAGSYSRELAALAQGFSYRIVAGDGQSKRHQVDVVTPPYLDQVRLLVTPPAFTGLSEQVIDGGDAEILQGSQLTIQASFGGRDVAQVLISTNGQASEAMNGSPALMQWNGDLSEDVDYHFTVVTKSGEHIELPERFELQAVGDKAPKARLSGTAIDDGLVGKDGLTTVTVSGSDDVALKAMTLLIETDGMSWRRPLPVEGSLGSRYEYAEVIDFTDLPVTPGQFVMLRAEVEDVGGNISRSKGAEILIAQEGQGGHRRLAHLLEENTKQLRKLMEKWAAQRTAFEEIQRNLVGGSSATLEGELISTSRSIRRLISSQHKRIQGLRDEVLLVDDPFAPFVEQILSNQLSWFEGTADIAAHKAEQIAKQDETQWEALLEESLLTLVIAQEDLRALHKTVQLALGRSHSAAEAEYLGLLGIQQAQQIEAVTGWRGWGQREPNPGLRARFYKGKSFNGQPHVTMAGEPTLRDYRPKGLTRDDWSLRYDGSVYLPKEGEWALRVRVDDGVRLHINGQKILDSWKDQSTEVTGTFTVTSPGWHRFTLDHYQAKGGQRLALLWREPASKNWKRFDRYAYQHDGDGSGDQSRLLAAMSQISAERIELISAELITKSREFGQIGSELNAMVKRLNVGDKDLSRLSQNAENLGGRLIATAGEVKDLGWSRGQLERLRPSTQSLEQTTLDLRKRFDDMLKRTVSLDQQAGDSVVRQVAAEMNRLRQRSRSVSDAQAHRELAHRQRTYAHAQERLNQARADLMRQAEDASRPLEARRQALNAAARLNKLANHDLNTLMKEVAPRDKASRRDLSQRGLDNARSELLKIDHQIAASRRANDAGTLRDVVRAVEAQRQEKGDLNRQALLRDQQEQAIETLAAQARERGDLATANEWEDLKRLDDLNKTAEFAQQQLAKSQPKSAQTSANPWLKETERALAEQDIVGAEAAREAAVQALSLEASRSALNRREDLAKAQLALAESLAAVNLAQDPSALKTLALQTENLEKSLSNRGRQQQMLKQLAQQHDLEATKLNEEAGTLNRLASQARSTKEAEREALREQLAALAGEALDGQSERLAERKAGIVAAQELAREADRQNQELEALRDHVAERLAELAAEQAEVEAELAQVAENLAGQDNLSSDRLHKQVDETAEALGQLRSALTDAQQNLEESAETLSAQLLELQGEPTASSREQLAAVADQAKALEQIGADVANDLTEELAQQHEFARLDDQQRLA